MSSPRTTIIVTQRERFTEYQTSLASLYDTNEPFNLIYVDMGSPVWIQEQIDRDAADRGFRVIRLDQIVSQNRARNIGVKHAETEFVVFVDNDVRLSRGWLEKLIACADETDAAIVGPLVMEGTAEGGIVHFIRGDGHIEQRKRGNYFVRSHPFVRQHISTVDQTYLQRTETETLEFHALLVRRSLMNKLGDLDEELMTIADHDDLCMLARQHGEKVFAEPAAVVRYDYSVPLQWCDLSYFILRWSANWTRRSINRFADKYRLAADEPYRKSIFKWVMKHHKDLPFPPMGGPVITAIVRLALEIVTELSFYSPPKDLQVTLLEPKRAKPPQPIQAVH